MIGMIKVGHPLPRPIREPHWSLCHLLGDSLSLFWVHLSPFMATDMSNHGGRPSRQGLSLAKKKNTIGSGSLCLARRTFKRNGKRKKKEERLDYFRLNPKRPPEARRGNRGINPKGQKQRHKKKLAVSSGCRRRPGQGQEQSKYSPV